VSISEIKPATGNRRTQIIEVLDEIKAEVEKGKRLGDMIVMLKVDGGYLRFSTEIEDTMALVANLELMKYDVLRRMAS